MSRAGINEYHRAFDCDEYPKYAVEDLLRSKLVNKDDVRATGLMFFQFGVSRAQSVSQWCIAVDIVPPG